MVGGLNGYLDDLSCGEMYDLNIDDWIFVLELRINCCNVGKNIFLINIVSVYLWFNLWVIDMVYFFLGVCVLNGKLYIVGGFDLYG